MQDFLFEFFSIAMLWERTGIYCQLTSWVWDSHINLPNELAVDHGLGYAVNYDDHSNI